MMQATLRHSAMSRARSSARSNSNDSRFSSIVMPLQRTNRRLRPDSGTGCGGGVGSGRGSSRLIRVAPGCRKRRTYSKQLLIGQVVFIVTRRSRPPPPQGHQRQWQVSLPGNVAVGRPVHWPEWLTGSALKRISPAGCLLQRTGPRACSQDQAIFLLPLRAQGAKDEG